MGQTMKLAAEFPVRADGPCPLVIRVTRNPGMEKTERPLHALISDAPPDASGFAVNFISPRNASAQPGHIQLPDELCYLEEGDIIRVNYQAGQIRVLYRKNSNHNVLFFTERCNSRCIMCSQPPRDVQDDWLVDDILKALPLMSPDTRQLCITGGEPTLLFDRLIEVVRATKNQLPNTALHMLSNGRLFSYLKLAQSLGEVGHPDLMVGIPLYSDIPSQHNYVVQAEGAFDETVLGFMNLARTGIKTELRLVIHKHTYERMPQVAAFIARNLPFVSHVALMGLEPIGFGKSNIQHLWIDPIEYQQPLEEAVEVLSAAGLTVSVYNIQRCLLPESLYSCARKSISDWKNIYLPECDDCTAKDECSGFFSSASVWHSKHIMPFKSIGNPILSMT